MIDINLLKRVAVAKVLGKYLFGIDRMQIKLCHGIRLVGKISAVKCEHLGIGKLLIELF